MRPTDLFKRAARGLARAAGYEIRRRPPAVVADPAKYGRFDLAFAHGVYYDSTAPFVFLENLAGLADAVFVGGYVLKEGDAHEVLEHGGEAYRVRPYREAPGNFTAGINPTSYYLP